MHAGARVLRLCKGSTGTWAFEVIAQFTDHQSMNYGSDIQPALPSEPDRKAQGPEKVSGKESVRTVVSTSFYDKLLCVWRFDMDAQEPAAVGEGAEG